MTEDQMLSDDWEKHWTIEDDLQVAEDELRWSLAMRAEHLLRGERTCEYGSMMRDNIREEIAEVRRLRTLVAAKR